MVSLAVASSQLISGGPKGVLSITFSLPMSVTQCHNLQTLPFFCVLHRLFLDLAYYMNISPLQVLQSGTVDHITLTTFRNGMCTLRWDTVKVSRVSTGWLSV